SITVVVWERKGGGRERESGVGLRLNRAEPLASADRPRDRWFRSALRIVPREPAAELFRSRRERGNIVPNGSYNRVVTRRAIRCPLNAKPCATGTAYSACC